MVTTGRCSLYENPPVSESLLLWVNVRLSPGLLQVSSDSASSCSHWLDTCASILGSVARNGVAGSWNRLDNIKIAFKVVVPKPHPR